MSEVTIEKPIDRSWPQFNEEKFIPQIANELSFAKENVHNCIAIDLDLSVFSTLDFSLAEKKIEEIKNSSFLIFFVINLHLEKTYESYFDEVIFESIRLGMKIFQEKLLKPNLPKVFGFGLNFGRLREDFISSPLAESKLKQYLEETYGSKSDQYRFDKEAHLFQVSLIAEYLHRIAACVQESVEVYAFLDLRKFSPIEILQFISPDRFSYMRIGLKGCNLPSLGLNLGEGKMIGGVIGGNVTEIITPEIGLLFPADHKLTSNLEKDYEEFLEKLLQLNRPFYVLYEESMTENWQNLEKVIVHSKFVDPLLKRKCMGFAVADGSIVSYGGNIGIFEEINFTDL